MRVKLITCRYTPTLGCFDDSPLREFIRDKEVLSFKEHFFVVNEVPHLACVVTYQDAVVPPETLELAAAVRREGTVAPAAGIAPIRATAERHRREGRPDPASGLAEPERLLFNTIREWRTAKARKEGVPPYVILTNRQLVEIVVKRPASRTALAGLEGVGSAKVERYGEEIVALLGGAAAPPTAPLPVEVAP